jgi:hypothetical protein
LQGTQVDNTQYGLLLSQLPDIADIRFRKSADDILGHINVDTLPKITHAYCCGTNNNMLVQRCPKIRKLELNPPAGNLSSLTALTELRRLEVSHGDYVTSNLNAVLTGIGPNLIQLILESIKDVNLRDIVTLCPSLNILVLFYCRYLPLKVNAPLDPQLLHLRNLTSLKIVRTCEDELDCSFIRHYVSLEKIDLNSVDFFNIEFMSEVSSLGTLANLKEFYIREGDDAAMTLEVVQLLIDHCSRSKIFGCMGYLPLLDSSDAADLRTKETTHLSWCKFCKLWGSCIRTAFQYFLFL